MDLQYKIIFLDYWHTSSGLSAGAKLDSSVLKDSDNLPYLSGKTIKGLVREMAELLGSNDFVDSCFGREGIDMGECYFSNASLDNTTKDEIVSNNLQDNLYDTVASTKIGDNGVAVDDSLREIEVVIPITLEGYIDDVSDEYQEDLIKALKMIKRVGLNRNRGLGRCEFKDIKCKN